MSGESDDALGLSRATVWNVWPASCAGRRRRSAVVVDDLDVEPARHRVLAVRRPNGPVLPLDQPGARVTGLDAQRGEHGAVEALGRGEIRDGDSDVVEHPGEATVAGILDAGETANAQIARLAGDASEREGGGWQDLLRNEAQQGQG